MDWEATRQGEFPVANQWAYMDHAAISPLPRRAADAMVAYANDQQAHGCVNWLDRRNELERIRSRVARLLNAEPTEIAFVTSTTMGIGLIAEGFPWRDGDNLVTAAEEYPSNLFPWMNLQSRGVETRTVRSRDGRIWPEDLIEAMDDRTRLLTISHVEFSSGFRHNLDRLGELCQSRGVALFVDAIQGLGPHRIDLQKTPVDFLAADSHKWLLGPEGAGIMYVRASWIDRLRPLGVGSNSVTSSYNDPEPAFSLKPDAGRWEGGCYNMAGLLAMGRSLELIEELGPARVSARILELADQVRDRVERLGWSSVGSQAAEDRSGIAVFDRDGVDHDAVIRSLRSQGIVVSCRRSRLRISPHCYNNQDDLDRLQDGLNHAIKSL